MIVLIFIPAHAGVPTDLAIHASLQSMIPDYDDTLGMCLKVTQT